MQQRNLLISGLPPSPLSLSLSLSLSLPPSFPLLPFFGKNGGRRSGDGSSSNSWNALCASCCCFSCCSRDRATLIERKEGGKSKPITRARSLHPLPARRTRDDSRSLRVREHATVCMCAKCARTCLRRLVFQRASGYI